MADNLARAACAILRTDRKLSADFREHTAQMIEALDQLYTEALMVKMAHDRAKQPHYSKGLEMARSALEAKMAEPEGRELKADVGRRRAALEECEEYFDQRADADQPPGASYPIGNEEMHLLGIVRTALEKNNGRD